MTAFAILLALIAFSPTQTIAKEPGGGQGGGGGGGNRAGGTQGVAAGQSGVQPAGVGNAQGGVHPAGIAAKQGGAQPVGVANAQGSVHPTGGAAKQGGVQPIGVGGNAANNLGVRPSTGVAGNEGMMPHQIYDARRRPEFSGGAIEGRDSWRYRWDNGRWWFWGPSNQWMWYGNDGQWLNYSNTYAVQRPVLENLPSGVNFSGGPITIINPETNRAAMNYTLDGVAYTIAPGYSQDFRADRAWVLQFNPGANLEQKRYELQSGMYTFARTNQGSELYRSELPQTVALRPPTVTPRAPVAAQTPPSTQ